MRSPPGPGAGLAARPPRARRQHVHARRGAGKAGTRDQGQGTRDIREQGTEFDGEPGRVHALFVYNSNPGAVAPNHNAVVRGLERDDLFTVVHELFFTDTTDYADYVLPATTFLEHTDVQGAYGHYFVQFSHQAIEPARRIALQRVALQPACRAHGLRRRLFPRFAEEMIRQALAQRPRALHATRHGAHYGGRAEGEGPHPARFHRHPEAAPFQPYVAGQLPTPSGKVEFYSETLAAQGLDPPSPLCPRLWNRAGAKARSAIPSNCSAAKRTTT